MKGPDVIGIGAINFDYIFDFDPGKDGGKPQAVEIGIEDLGNNKRDELVEGRIFDRVAKDSELIVEVGGSAYRTVKTISTMNCGLTTACVGVYAQGEKTESKAGFFYDPKTEFRHLTNSNWLFESKGKPGRALIKLHKGLRHSIEIGPGVNTKLQQSVCEQERKLGKSNPSDDHVVEPFTMFLASARWVHLTSLSDFNQFEFFVDRITDAKLINPHLRFSLDPGDEYTRNYADKLSNAFSAADYIFLSEKEFNNIKGGQDFPWRTRVDAVGLLARESERFDTQVLIVKSQNHHILLNYLNGNPLKRKFWHHRLWRTQIRNDTGAGDVFAGGVIAGLLSSYLITHQPAPIRLGAILAAEKLRAGKTPTDKIRTKSHEFFEKDQKNEHDNIRQKIQTWWENSWPLIVSSVISFLTGLVLALLFS